MRVKGLEAIALCLNQSPEFIGLLLKTDGLPVWFEGKVPVANAAVLKLWAEKQLGEITTPIVEPIQTRGTHAD